MSLGWFILRNFEFIRSLREGLIANHYPTTRSVCRSVRALGPWMSMRIATDHYFGKRPRLWIN
jgi:hypothetical protein